MPAPKPRRERPPLNSAKLEEMALRYVGRFATTRAKLLDYLRRKVQERGWAGEGSPELEAIADRFRRSGYVDDAAYALAKSRSLTGRGYGKSRVVQSLRLAGVGEEDGAEARELAEEERIEAALRFARRRRIGPFATTAHDPKGFDKALASMIRAGHDLTVSKAILRLPPGQEPEAGELFANFM
ncbi:RecX family transcriptional regulator [Sphingomonas piscis]|uniref:RecX family transcriptional regulator n=1 Tax=Sphingomonas piscis TaxID=2714943 RepID=A0A6G7YN14_9SPHN|nr:RecX family transcriptional regulator [Sphingomonas piscis]QIK78133.1 RecX family transcriptional regulator [Sphingomonas piscis]